jgi:hypothetical protein
VSVVASATSGGFNAVEFCRSYDRLLKLDRAARRLALVGQYAGKRDRRAISGGAERTTITLRRAAINIDRDNTQPGCKTVRVAASPQFGASAPIIITARANDWRIPEPPGIAVGLRRSSRHAGRRNSCIAACPRPGWCYNFVALCAGWRDVRARRIERIVDLAAS